MIVAPRAAGQSEYPNLTFGLDFDEQPAYVSAEWDPLISSYGYLSYASAIITIQRPQAGTNVWSTLASATLLPITTTQFYQQLDDDEVPNSSYDRLWRAELRVRYSASDASTVLVCRSDEISTDDVPMSATQTPTVTPTFTATPMYPAETSRPWSR